MAGGRRVEAPRRVWEGRQKRTGVGECGRGLVRHAWGIVAAEIGHVMNAGRAESDAAETGKERVAEVFDGVSTVAGVDGLEGANETIDIVGGKSAGHGKDAIGYCSGGEEGCRGQGR